MKVNIVKENLDEETALFLEQCLIIQYVFYMGYGIDIPGFNNKDNEPGHLTNCTFGGDGVHGLVHTEEWCKQHSIDMSGDKNPMYGVNLWETFSEEKKKIIKQKLSNAFSGENNPMYGVSPEERMDAKTYKQWKEKVSTRAKNNTGEKNPNYGNKTLHNKVKDRPDLRILYYSRPGGTNGKAKKVYMYNSKLELVEKFDCIKSACEWLIYTHNMDYKIGTLHHKITNSIKNNEQCFGYKFTFEEIT